MPATTTRLLAMPAATSGILMAVYLLLRPYGDSLSSTSTEAAAAFASRWWVVAHLAGALALVQLGRVGLRVDDLLATSTTRIARWAGLAGAVLVLPYYGAEAFGLHVIGRAGMSDPSVMALVDEVRGHPAALTTFGLGLLLLAVSGIATAGGWQQAARAQGWAVPALAPWPLAVATILLLPQYSLPPTGRMIYGIAYAAAAMVLALTAARAAHRAVPATVTGTDSLPCAPRA